MLTFKKVFVILDEQLAKRSVKFKKIKKSK